MAKGKTVLTKLAGEKNDRKRVAGVYLFLASGARVWNMFMMFIVLVGTLPLLFPQWLLVGNKLLVFFIVGLIFITSLIYEIWRSVLEKQGKSTVIVVNCQLLTRVVLLTAFLHFFGRINGPFFVLYLLVIMESFLNRNIFLSNTIVSAMVFATTAEFVWLLFTREVVLEFIPIIAFVIRTLSIMFMHAYGSVLAQKIFSEETEARKTKKTTEEMHQLTSELKKIGVKIKDLSGLKDEFVSVASHELRAPMTTIKGYISMILEGDAGKVPPKVKEYLEDAYESNDRMIRLINNMLNISRIESGRLVMTLKDIQIEGIVKDVVKSFQLEAEGHGLELKYFAPEKILPKVRVDPDRVREIISNLIGNAINFTPHGHIHLKSYQDDGMVITSVEDTGVGIAVQDQKQLFKKFSQVEAKIPFKKGSGLGLYICKMLLNEFGGNIWLESRVGKGTSFYFNLPAITARRHK